MDDSETAKPVSWTRTGAILAFLAVALGAFGAHKLKTLVGDEQLAWWETGVHYQLAHALALLILGQRALFSSGPDPTAIHSTRLAPASVGCSVNKTPEY